MNRDCALSHSTTIAEVGSPTNGNFAARLKLSSRACGIVAMANVMFGRTSSGTGRARYIAQTRPGLRMFAHVAQGNGRCSGQ
jgi:hypothetical protein